MEAQASFQAGPTGRLYLVPTPIGNLDDMTFRAVKVLKAVDLIAAEDTRHTRQLLNHFAIPTPTISFHEHNTEQRLPQLLDHLLAGQDLAQCSDAGMPSISDPGHELVNACIEHGIPVVPLPGANAGLTALIASGLSPQPFYFYGFLDRKSGARTTELQALKNRTETLIFYEAPHRLGQTLKAMVAVLGPDRPVVLARELTKRYEEFLRGTLADALAWRQTATVRGEFVVLVGGNPAPTVATAAPAIGDPLAAIRAKVQAGLTPTAAIKQVAKAQGLNRQALYRQYHQL